MTDDFIVVRMQGFSNAGGNPDLIANKIMATWRLVPSPDAKDGSLSFDAVPSQNDRDKYKLKIWRQGVLRLARLILEDGSREYNLDNGAVTSEHLAGAGSSHKEFTVQGNRLKMILECREVPINGPVIAPIIPAVRTAPIVAPVSPEVMAKLKPVEQIVMNIPVVLIDPNPDQPRKRFNKHELIQLGNSMKEEGQNEPIEVIIVKDGPIPRYELVKGERRWRAAQVIGMETLRAVVFTRKDIPSRDSQHRRCLVADSHHSKYSSYETAMGLIRHYKLGLSEVVLASICGRKVQWVKDHLAMNRLHPDLFKLMDPELPRDDRLSFSVASILVEAPGDKQKEIYQQISAIKGDRLRLLKANQLVSVFVSYSKRRRKPAYNVRRMLKSVPRVAADVLTVNGYPPASFESIADNHPDDAELLLRHVAEAIEGLKSIQEKLRRAVEKDTQFRSVVA
jgi:ParB/RepB/Spo0J family partition protein